MRTIQVVNVRWYNATAWYGVTLARCLQHAGHPSLVAGLAGTPPLEKAREMGLPTVELPFNSQTPGKLMELWRGMDRLVRDFRPDIVNCHRGEAFVLWALLKKRHGFGLVRTRGDRRLPRGGAVNRWLHCRAADAVIATNSLMTRHFAEVLHVPSSRLHTILGGVDTERFHADAEARRLMRQCYGYGEDHIVMGLLGRMDSVKGIRESIEALALARKLSPLAQRLRFLVIGFDSEFSTADVARWTREQGLGDAFLFSRFLFELKNKAAKIILRTPQTTLELLKNNFKFAEVISSDEDNLNKIRFDYHIPLMSIPMAINLSPDNISHTEKYISANDEKARRYKEKFFKGDKFKIGFSYQGSTVGLATRDIELKFLEPLFNIPNVECYMLQYKIRDEIYKGMNVKNLGNNIKDFDDTAAMIENMDLIVTTDNSILNLAGAMGKKTFALFNNVPEFRWFDLTGDDVKWYKSVKPYIADKQNNWAPLIQKVKSDIEGLVK